MPELPEVERARRELESVATGRRIKSVTAVDDNIVFSGISPGAFATALKGKKVLDVRRKGKNFYMVLESSNYTPIFHLGMAGSTQVRGCAAATYRLPRGPTDKSIFPPKYSKCVITFEDLAGVEVAEWSYNDSRRLGRIKLVEGVDPLEVPPLSLLGDDPLLNMPSVDILAAALLKRKAPIKAILLDQNKPLCGIGNWMVDEILYQSRIHPSHPGSLLTQEQIALIHYNVRFVTITAVNVNANSKKFPSDWLFRQRWGKGKTGRKPFTLPDGTTEVIIYETVGGRTSAIVPSMQVLPDSVIASLAAKVKVTRKKSIAAVEEDVESEEGAEEGGEEEEEEEMTSPHFKRTRSIIDVDATVSPHFDASPSPTKVRKSRAKKSVKLDDE